MKLSDAKVRKVAPTDKEVKLADGLGLYLVVRPNGAKLWRQKYRFAGKEKKLSHGAYPEVSLAEARRLRDIARERLREGIDPAVAKKRDAVAVQMRAGETFEAIAREWHEINKGRWAPVHAGDVIRSLERDVFPTLGAIPIADLDAPIVLDCLRRIERRGSIETAKRIRQRMSAVFVYAISGGRATNDPAAIVAGALQPMKKKGRQPALTDLDELRTLLSTAEASGGYPITKLASRLLALTAVRPSVVRGVGWGEFENIDWQGDAKDSPAAIWRVPSDRMKLASEKKGDGQFDHIVYLPWQAVEVLLAVQKLTDRCPMVFPSQRSSHRPLSENAIGYLYNRVGYHGRHVPHGWRAAFSTVMNERHPTQRALIDLMLAHSPKDKVEAAYNRATHEARRRQLASEWADLLMDGMGSAFDLLDGMRR